MLRNRKYGPFAFSRPIITLLHRSQTFLIVAILQYCAPWNEFPLISVFTQAAFCLKCYFLYPLCPLLFHTLLIFTHSSLSGSSFLTSFVWFCCCSVAQSCPTLCNPMDCSMPGFPVFNYLPEFAQTHVHWVDDAIQPSHPLSAPSLLALNLSQYQGLFRWVSSLHQVAKVLEFQLQRQSFQWNIQDWFPLGLTGLISLQSRELSRVVSSTTIRKHNSSALDLLYGPTLTSIHNYWKNHSFDLVWFSCSVFVLLFSPWKKSHKTIALFFAVIIDYLIIGCLIIDCKLRAEIMSCFCDLYVINAQKMHLTGGINEFYFMSGTFAQAIF